MLGIMKFLFWLTLVLVGFVISLLVIDRFVLRKIATPTHSQQTAKLPLLDDQTANGWVRIPVGDLQFRAHVANLDKKDAEPVILLHGFPETSEMWDPLFNKLADSGYRVVAFDQRGYSPGARPLKVADYEMKDLVQDLVGVADKVGFQRFHLVGHDWGSVVGWVGATSVNDRIASFSALSVGHLSAFREAINSDQSDQKKRSSYMGLLRMKYVPETLFLFNNGYLLRTRLYNTMSAKLQNHYVQIFMEPGALTGVLNWYRANTGGVRPDFPAVNVPTLYIYGNKDLAVSRMAAENTKKYVSGPYRFVEVDASHWLMSEVPEQVTREVLAHIQKYKIQ